MQVRILWVAPGEKRFSPGEVFTVEQAEEFEINIDDLVSRGEVEIVVDLGAAAAAAAAAATDAVADAVAAPASAPAKGKK